MLQDEASVALAGLCCFGAAGLGFMQIALHLRNYTAPFFQRFIVRLSFMVPVYAISSWFCLVLAEDDAWYVELFRDVYEAWVIYNFLSLCLAYVGGPGSVANKSDGIQVEPSLLWLTCCLPPIPVDGKFVRHCKQGALQFVFIKPIIAFTVLILQYKGVYGQGEVDAAQGYVWVQVVYNLSYSVALYALLLFYLGAHHLLEPFKPVLKFIIVKAVIFLTFWQGLLCAMLYGMGTLQSASDARNLQNFLLCVEMLPAAVGMLYAFPYTDYAKASAGGKAGFLGGALHAISMHDVVNDTVHQFAPTYHDYVLHSEGSTGSQIRRFRARTFVLQGREMSLFGAGGLASQDGNAQEQRETSVDEPTPGWSPAGSPIPESDEEEGRVGTDAVEAVVAEGGGPDNDDDDDDDDDDAPQAPAPDPEAGHSG